MLYSIVHKRVYLAANYMKIIKYESEFVGIIVQVVRVSMSSFHPLFIKVLLLCLNASIFFLN